MHFMIVGALLHATVLGILAFFVLFAAGKASGFTALLGRLLGYWVLLLAVLGLVLGLGGAITGKPMMGMGPGPWMHGKWGHMMQQQDATPAAPDAKAAPEPAAPASAEPAKPQ